MVAGVADAHKVFEVADAQSVRGSLMHIDIRSMGLLMQKKVPGQ